MKTLLLILVVIGATLALWVLLPQEQGDGVRLEPRARPARTAQVAPDANLVQAAPRDHPDLVATPDPAPDETREAVHEPPSPPVRNELLPFDVLDAGQKIQLMDLIQSKWGERISGRYIVTGQTLTVFKTSNKQTQRPDGSWIENYDGDEPKAQGQIRNGREVGLWIYWHENGERSAEGRYVNGERHGLWTSWYADGSKESEGLYSYAKREGSWIDFHEGGKRQQIATYANGELEGRVVRWHANGTKESEAYCVGNALDGPWRGWYPTGATSARGDYRYGKRVGRWTFLDANGDLNPSRSGRYENDAKVAD